MAAKVQTQLDQMQSKILWLQNMFSDHKEEPEAEEEAKQNAGNRRPNQEEAKDNDLAGLNYDAADFDECSPAEQHKNLRDSRREIRTNDLHRSILL